MERPALRNHCPVDVSLRNWILTHPMWGPLCEGKTHHELLEDRGETDVTDGGCPFLIIPALTLHRGCEIVSSLRDKYVLRSSVSPAACKGACPSEVFFLARESSAGRPISVINKLTKRLCQKNNKLLNNSIGADWSEDFTSQYASQSSASGAAVPHKQNSSQSQHTELWTCIFYSYGLIRECKNVSCCLSRVWYHSERLYGWFSNGVSWLPSPGVQYLYLCSHTISALLLLLFLFQRDKMFPHISQD